MGQRDYGENTDISNPKSFLILEGKSETVNESWVNYFKKKSIEWAAGLNSRQLASAIGCHSQQIYNFEAGYAVLPALSI